VITGYKKAAVMPYFLSWQNNIQESTSLYRPSQGRKKLKIYRTPKGPAAIVCTSTCSVQTEVAKPLGKK
jgi:hypothetical protein